MSVEAEKGMSRFQLFDLEGVTWVGQVQTKHVSEKEYKLVLQEMPKADTRWKTTQWTIGTPLTDAEKAAILSFSMPKMFTPHCWIDEERTLALIMKSEFEGGFIARMPKQSDVPAADLIEIVARMGKTDPTGKFEQIGSLVYVPSPAPSDAHQFRWNGAGRPSEEFKKATGTSLIARAIGSDKTVFLVGIMILRRK